MSGGIFQLIANDGRQDRMLLATELLNKRIAEITNERNRRIALTHLKRAVNLYRRYIMLKKCLYRIRQDMDHPMYLPEDMWRVICIEIHQEILFELAGYDPTVSMCDIEQHTPNLAELCYKKKESKLKKRENCKNKHAEINHTSHNTSVDKPPANS